MSMIIGALVGVLVCEISRILDKRYYVQKSIRKNRTPAHIGDGFYYIVPDYEYLQLDLLRSKDNQRGD